MIMEIKGSQLTFIPPFLDLQLQSPITAVIFSWGECWSSQMHWRNLPQICLSSRTLLSVMLVFALIPVYVLSENFAGFEFSSRMQKECLSTLKWWILRGSLSFKLHLFPWEIVTPNLTVLHVFLCLQFPQKRGHRKVIFQLLAVRYWWNIVVLLPEGWVVRLLAKGANLWSNSLGYWHVRSTREEELKCTIWC